MRDRTCPCYHVSLIVSAINTTLLKVKSLPLIIDITQYHTLYLVKSFICAVKQKIILYSVKVTGKVGHKPGQLVAKRESTQEISNQN